MSKSAAISGTFAYPSPGGARVVDSLSIVAPYDSDQVGDISVPSGATPSTAYSVSFGDISVATSLFVKNHSAVALKVTLADFNLPPGGIVVIAAPTAPAANGLAAMTMTTVSTAATAGSIECRVMGYPT